jgi:hypothetical protein
MPLRTPPEPARRVRRMHVRAHADDDARHAATLLADALRTASLPAPDEGRLVVIQRLALGRIPVRVSPSSLALHIERVAHDVMSRAVTFDVPAAGAANAVVFPDRSDAIVALAGLYAGGARMNGSGPKWSMAGARTRRAPNWSPLPRRPGVPGIVAAAVIDRAMGAGVEDVLSSVPTGQGAAGYAWRAGAVIADAAPPIWRPPSLFSRGHPPVAGHGADDDRLIWLTTLLTVLEHRHVPRIIGYRPESLCAEDVPEPGQQA